MTLENKLKFDEEGFHYFVESSHVSNAKGYNFINSAYVHENNFKDRILYVVFRDGYLADFGSEIIADLLDDKLREIEGIEGVYWEDRELFNITYKEGQSIKKLINTIDKKVTELSEFED